MFKFVGWFASAVWPEKPSGGRFSNARLCSTRLKADCSFRRLATVFSLQANDVGAVEAGKKRIFTFQLFAPANYLDVTTANFVDRREATL